MAAVVEASANEPSSLVELDWDDPRVLSCLVRYNKTSLLHHYIFSTIAVHDRVEYRRNGDLYEEYADLRDDIEPTLTAYDIDFIPYEAYCSRLKPAEKDSGVFHEWFLSQGQAFEQLWSAQTEEVFHLLFANRSFLLQFNESVAAFLSEGRVELSADFLDVNGKLKRQITVPAWLKRAIFHRDQGRCVLCQKDLTGLVNTAIDLNLDHIVPLNCWGINDPCNLQLLCAMCNGQKSDGKPATATRYIPWWDY